MKLTQSEADELLILDKYYEGNKEFSYPSIGGSLRIPLISRDRREFILDISRGRIKLEKNKFQTRTHKSMQLARLEINGSPHTNPDGSVIGGTHLHLYREGYGLRWAYPLPPEFDECGNALEFMSTFMALCHIVKRPVIHGDMFT